MFEYNNEITDDKLVVTFYGDIDIDSVDIIEDNLMPDLNRQHHVKLNLAHVDFVDSTGIGLLIKLANHISEMGVTLTITNIRNDVLDVLKLLQVPEILDFVVFPQLSD